MQASSGYSCITVRPSPHSAAGATAGGSSRIDRTAPRVIHHTRGGGRLRGERLRDREPSTARASARSALRRLGSVPDAHDVVGRRALARGGPQVDCMQLAPRSDSSAQTLRGQASPSFAPTTTQRPAGSDASERVDRHATRSRNIASATRAIDRQRARTRPAWRGSPRGCGHDAPARIDDRHVGAERRPARRTVVRCTEIHASVSARRATCTRSNVNGT